MKLARSLSLALSLAVALSPILLGCSPTLAPAPPHAFAAPALATAPAAACWIEFASGDAPGSFGLNGSPDFEPWLVTYSGLLVRHPRGDVLVDTGMSASVAEALKTTHFVSRLLFHVLLGNASDVTPAPVALARAGEKPADVRAIVLSHVHFDHAGGAVDLPATAMYLGAADVALARAEKDDGGFDVVKPVAEAIAQRGRAVVFADKPYETFDRSFDLYGDGSIVLVPLPGHTPGSVGTFVNLPGLRIFHVGDATNTFEAVLKRRSKSLPLSITDRDGRLADETLAKISQLHERDPNLVILPAHDRRIWTGLFGEPGRCFPPRR